MAIELMEDVMNTIYELDYKSARRYQRFKPADLKAKLTTRGSAAK
jgi:hypothetical protein